ncbi:MAG: MarR family transcriptional regulator [Actinomycetota bacterium]|nr:MarR family transcriptional regulator [Actinomycetota bacterium]
MLAANHVGAFARLVVDRQAAADGDRSASATAVVLTLLHHGPMTTTELARIIGVRQPTAHRLVGHLVDDGLVERRGGGRRVELRLTRRGRAATHRSQRARVEVVEGLLGVLSAEELAFLDDAVSRVLAAATPDRATARNLCRFCDHAVCDGPACPVGMAATARERDRRDDAPDGSRTHDDHPFEERP